jgi:hypothetical protein
MGGENKFDDCAEHSTAPVTKSYPVGNVESFNTAASNSEWQVVASLAVKRFRFSGAQSADSSIVLDLGGQGVIVLPADAPAGSADNSTYLDGYYPIIANVYALDVQISAAMGSSQVSLLAVLLAIMATKIVQAI